MLAAYTACLHEEMNGIGDAIGGAVVMLFPGVIGLSVRYRAAAQLRDIDHAKLKEREQLARELHDSVAHHMTAITIQAQAARAVLRSRPEDAERALEAIEQESRHTLDELREIVGALREDDEAAISPTGRIADIATFARDAGATAAVTVELSGDLDRLAPAVQRAVFRMAQESITNAIKHAKNATCIAIRVAVHGDTVHLTARDNGMPSSARPNAGFGLIGMAERAALLGGTFDAGPSNDGWCVNAVLPRAGGAA
jgi:signal transduction histidine kinase